MLIHWEESENERGMPVWLRYLDCGHWGLILTAVLPRYGYLGRGQGVVDARGV